MNGRETIYDNSCCPVSIKYIGAVNREDRTLHKIILRENRLHGKPLKHSIKNRITNTFKRYSYCHDKTIMRYVTQNKTILYSTIFEIANGEADDDSL